MKQVPVILFGAGGVGQALLKQLVGSRGRVAARLDCRLEVVAVADSISWLWREQGFKDEQLRQIVEIKRKGMPVAALSLTSGKMADRPPLLDILDQAKAAGQERAIVVDVTAAEGMEPVLDRALELDYSIVMANKKALAGPWATARYYTNHPRVRHESTVGGGQPVIATLRTLLDVNDLIYEIGGQLSGTLGYICQCLDKGVPFSQAVAAAREQGFTEPDPREDLGGQDVMRKVMILARMAGWPLEAADIKVESLYPSEMADLSVESFIRRSSELDQEMGQRVSSAAAGGFVLRYLAEVNEKGGVVGLKELPAHSPLANLKYISFRTERYDDEPLLIGGKGAGVDMTAAGVLGDMLAMVREGFA